MFSFTAKLLHVTDTFVPTGPADGVNEQAGSGDGVGPDWVTVKVAEMRAPLTLPVASTLWLPTVASEGTTKLIDAPPLSELVPVAAVMDAESVVNHRTVIVSVGPKPVAVAMTVDPASPERGSQDGRANARSAST